MPDLLTSIAPKGQSDTMQGVVEYFVFQNEDNSYCVAKFLPAGESEPINVVGALAGVSPGETLEVSGAWETHKTYGRQFTVSNFMPVLPSTLKGVEKFLGSGLIKGIGAVYASRIVKQFGMATLDILDRSPERLSEVPKLGAKRVEMIEKAWRARQAERQVMIFLMGQNISPAYAARIVKTYGSRAVEVLRENPYRLAEDVDGIGFKSADVIAMNQGIAQDSPFRARAGVLHALSSLAQQGHVCAPRAALLEASQKILGIAEEAISTAIDDLCAEAGPRQLASRRLGASGEIHYYLANLYRHEEFVAQKIKELIAAPKHLPAIDAEKEIAAFETDRRFKLAEQQRAAVVQALKGGVIVITGGPGTGKTTIVRTILRILEKYNVHFLLASPTGRAAKRLAETTGSRATTLHRMLKWSPHDGRFQYDRNNPLKTSLLVIDEVSMLDITLAARVLDALPDTTSLLLVGDADQLPSVGPGNVLGDLIESGVAPVVRLTEIFRQAQRSLIVRNAHRINHGEFPYIPKPEEKPRPDFYFTQKEEDEEALRAIKSLVSERIPFKFGFRPTEDIQVITPMHRGSLGTENLNNELQRLLNPSGKPLRRGHTEFRVGDKVMQIKNNYDKDVFNGDIGVILTIDTEDHEMKVAYESRTITYDYDELDQLILSYAISVHKAQGSEYRAVVMPIHTQHYIMLQRNLLYTALTRARELACIVGTKRALAIAVRNDRQARRWTGLKEMLRET
ncbi:MAG: ATP-dependent RecD-like DNA helicase [Candidatus Sumerlaeota bacterium]|nr:ATP-dependent RecD-like DNA helicase [Candidatus Sumerlaeota bacterium]